MMAISLKKLLFGYIPYTAIALVAISNSWTAVLGGGVIILFWAVSIILLQLLIFSFGYKSGFHAKCAALTLACIFLAPFALGLFLHLSTVLIYSSPDYEKDLALESAACTIKQVARDERMGISTYYIEVDLVCSTETKPVRRSWWYSYDNPSSTWQRSQPTNFQNEYA
jgi:hypothetical protein